MDSDCDSDRLLSRPLYGDGAGACEGGKLPSQFSSREVRPRTGGAGKCKLESLRFLAARSGQWNASRLALKGDDFGFYE